MLENIKRSESNNFNNTSNNNLDIKYNVDSIYVQEYNDTVELRKIKELL